MHGGTGYVPATPVRPRDIAVVTFKFPHFGLQ
jgi:hypothetical protein